MLEKILKLQNWARLAGFVTIFVSVIVCSFFYAISYPPPPSTASVGQRNQSSDSAEQQLSATEKRGTRSAPLAVEIVPSKEGAPESEYGKEILEKASNERGLTVATWVLAFATFFLFAAASVQVALFVWQLDLIRESLTDAKKAADAAEKSASAAKLNAQALIDAEAAQMYLIIQNSNIERMYQLGGTYYNSLTMHASSSDPPWIEYRLRNYGKSPAIVQSVFHRISLELPSAGAKSRDYQLGQDAMEIIGVGEQGQIIKCEFDGLFTFGDVRSVITNDRMLCFYGHSTFMDHFGREQTLEWELVADKARWNLTSHRNTRGNPET